MRKSDSRSFVAPLTFFARASRNGALRAALSQLRRCDSGDSASVAPSALCGAPVCVGVHPSSFVPACIATGAAGESRDVASEDDGGPWRRLAVSARALGAARIEMLFLASSLAGGNIARPPDALLIDELQIATLRAPRHVSAPFFEGPMPVAAAWAVIAMPPLVDHLRRQEEKRA